MGARRIDRDYDSKEEQFYHTKDEYYLEGSAVRKLQSDQRVYEIPDYEEEIQGRPKKQTRTKTKPQKKLSNISKGTCLVLIMAIAMTLFVCIDYIRSQTAMSMLNRDIIAMEQELTSIKEENKIQQEQLNAQLDLNNVYDIATNVYGMVPPIDDQIIYFETTLTDFVKQHEEIPGNR